MRATLHFQDGNRWDFDVNTREEGQAWEGSYFMPMGSSVKCEKVTFADDITENDFMRINSDINGNGRMVIHFLRCCPKSWLADYSADTYAKVTKLMNKIGGRKYHNNSYGGGIVFQCSSVEELIPYIEGLKAEIG